MYFLLETFPIILLVISVLGIILAVIFKRYRYIFGLIMFVLAYWIHYYAIYIVGKWKGMAMSMFGAGGLVVVGILILGTMLAYELVKRKRNREESNIYN